MPSATHISIFIVCSLLLFPAIKCVDFTIIGGNESEDDGASPGAWQFHKFYPNNITINAGDRIRFRTNDLEGHVVVFSEIAYPAPDGKGGLLMDNLTFPTGGNSVDGSKEISSGRLFKTTASPYPYEWYATFPQPGAFHFYCIFHPFTMYGDVYVNPADTPYVRTPAQVDADTKAALAADIALTPGLAEQENLIGTIVGVPNPDGEGKTYEVIVGWGNVVTGSAYMRFSPQATFTIQVGDTVNFTQGSMHTPHGVAINESGSFIDLESNQFIMGQDTIVREYVTPTGNPNFEGGFVSAGVFFPLDADLGISYYAVKFLKPGVYPFQCPYHSYTGMIGTITVCDGDFCGTDSSGDVGVSATHHNYAINYVLSSLLLLLLVVL